MIRLVAFCERASSLCDYFDKIRSLFSVCLTDRRLFEFQVTRICDRILKISIHGLPDCALTGQDCITFSRNKMYAYKCKETHVSQEIGGEKQREESLYSTIFLK